MSNKVVDLGVERPSREGLHPEREKWLTSMWVNFDRGQQRVIIIPREPPCLLLSERSFFFIPVEYRFSTHDRLFDSKLSRIKQTSNWNNF